MAMTKDSSADGDLQQLSTNKVICLSVNSLVQQELESRSELAEEIKTHIGIHGIISSSLVFAVLKQHLNKIEVQTPILLVDRKIASPSISNDIKLNNATVVHVRDSVHLNGVHLANGDVPKTDMQILNPTELSGIIVEEVKVPKKEPPQHSRLRSLMNCITGNDPRSESKSDEPNNKYDTIKSYFNKMRGGAKKPPYEMQFEALVSFITSFIGIAVLTSIDYYQLTYTKNTTVIGSFGASAVLLFSAIKSPLAQPRNLIFGHLQAALIGVTMQFLLGDKFPWLAAALAVSLSISLMCLTHTVHPPAGATALIAVYSDKKIHELGFLYTVIPVGVGAVILLIVALVTNNIFPSRRYPQYWY